jgi:hypothetical protein
MEKQAITVGNSGFLAAGFAIYAAMQNRLAHLPGT